MCLEFRRVLFRSTAGTLPRWPSASWYLLGGVDNVGGRAVGALPVVLS